jgi:hypothetical protein
VGSNLDRDFEFLKVPVWIQTVPEVFLYQLSWKVAE